MTETIALSKIDRRHGKTREEAERIAGWILEGMERLNERARAKQ